MPGLQVIPITGESIYSILARSHVLDANASPLVTLRNRTGIRGYKPLSGLPTHLEKLSKSVYVADGPIRLVQAHTHFPLYAHFLSEVRQELLKTAMFYTGSPKARLGLLRNDMGARDWRRFCTKCKEMDIERYGVATWHREHSLSGVMVCPIHGLPLIEHCTAGKYGERDLILPILGEEIFVPRSDDAREKLIFIASEIKTMMERPAKNMISGSVYRRLLQERDLLTKKDRIRQRSLEKMVTSWLSPLKNIIGFDKLISNLKVERSWVAELVDGSDGFHHPVKHIVLWGALGVDFNEVTNTASGPGIQLELDLRNNKHIDLTRDFIEELLAATKSYRQAAKTLGVDISVLQIAAESQSMHVPRRPKKISLEIRNLIANEFISIPSSILAKQYNVSVGTVNRIRRVARKNSQISIV